MDRTTIRSGMKVAGQALMGGALETLETFGLGIFSRIAPFPSALGLRARERLSAGQRTRSARIRHTTTLRPICPKAISWRTAILENPKAFS